MSDSVGLAPPATLETLGENEPPPETELSNTTAVVVFHGMGQQVAFETLDAVAQMLVEEHEANHGKTARRVRHVWSEDREGGRFLPRAEIELRDAEDNVLKTVHVYEAYWAPLTEGVIGFAATTTFFLRAGGRGIWTSMKDGKKFLRWAFGRERAFPLAPGTFVALVLATLLLLALIIALTVGAYWAWPEELREHFSFAALAKMGPSLLLGSIALLVTWIARRWIVQFLGDVAIYLGSNDLDQYWRIRREIKSEAHRVAAAVYRAVVRDDKDPNALQFQYEKIVLAGHSLGSVIAYDTLNALIQRDLAAHPANPLGVVDRTGALITFGSPLDKVAFIFGTRVRGRKMREALAGGVQPLIVDYEYRPQRWTNIYAKADLIAGSLGYFDMPDSGEGEGKRVNNQLDREASLFPPAAHTGYWNHDIVRNALYEATTR